MQSLREWMDEGPYTLALSSSFFGFYAHCGFMAAYQEHGFRPAKVSGASAGALVGAAWASGMDPADMSELLFSVRRHHFWDPWPGLGYLRGRKFLEFLKPHVKADFNETRLPVEVCVYDVFKRSTEFLASGPLPEAVVASCAVPLMFHPVRINGRLYIDGGVFRKSGMRYEARNERILCIFLESKGRRRSRECGKAAANLGANHRLLRFKELPAIDPLRLHTGPEAFHQAYLRAKRAFDIPFTGRLLEA